MAENSQSLGEYLRHERENRGITIEQVASASKVSVRLLHALESDHFADMPAKPFVRGFVTSYARFIGLDAQEILTRFDQFIDLKVRDRPKMDAGHSGYAFEKREGEQSRTILWMVMASFLLIGGILFVIFKPSLGKHRHKELDRLRAAQPTVTAVPSSVPAVPALAPASVAPQSDASPQPALVPEKDPYPVLGPSTLPTQTPPAQSPPEASVSVPRPVKPVKDSASTRLPATALKEESTREKPDPLNSGVHLNKDRIHYKLIFKAVNDVWVRYRVDDRNVMTFPLRHDRVLVLRAENSVQFQASDPTAVVYSLNGQSNKKLTEARGLVTHHGDITLVLSSKKPEKSLEIFPGEKKLPSQVPPPRNSAPSSDATQHD